MPKMIEPSLNNCRSAPHRAAMGLLAAAMGKKLPPELLDDLDQSDPQQLAQIANQHHIHTIIQSAFEQHAELKAALPHDLWIYFQMIYTENAQRNQQARQELTLLGSLFQQAGIDAVILKGGAEIVAPYYNDPAHRFISDLDILIPEDRIHEAAEILYARGGTSDPVEAHFHEHHHIPAISGGELPFRIELHKGVGDGFSSTLLPANDLFARAVSSDIRGIRIPAPEDRLMHHLLHGQLRSQLYARCLPNLRNCADHYHFQRRLDSEAFESVRARLEAHQLTPILDGLDTLTRWIFTQGLTGQDDASAKWAANALRNFGHPERQKYWDSLTWFKGYLTRFFTNADHRRRYLRKLFSVRGWIQFIAFHKERWQRFV